MNYAIELLQKELQRKKSNLHWRLQIQFEGSDSGQIIKRLQKEIPELEQAISALTPTRAKTKQDENSNRDS